MSWSFRKSIRVLPGIRISLSKSGPRLSVGIPGVRASVDMHGKARLYAGAGPVRYQKSVSIGSAREPGVATSGLLTWVKKIFNVR
jgi:hypothetical protein